MRIMRRIADCWYVVTPGQVGRGFRMMAIQLGRAVPGVALTLMLLNPAPCQRRDATRRYYPHCRRCFSGDCELRPIKVSSDLRSLIARERRAQADPYAGEQRDGMVRYDLNRNGTHEYFVPLACGATGNCTWGVFVDGPARMLGQVLGQYIYIRSSKTGWSRIIGYSRVGGDECVITTYRMRRGRYRSVSETIKQFSGLDGSPYLWQYGIPDCK